MVINEKKYVCKGSFRRVEDIKYLIIYLSKYFNFKLILKNNDKEMIISNLDEVLSYFKEEKEYIFNFAEFQFAPKILTKNETDKTKCILNNKSENYSWFIEYIEMDAIHIVPFETMFFFQKKVYKEKDKLISLPWKKITSVIISTLSVIFVFFYFLFNPIQIGWVSFPFFVILLVGYSIYISFAKKKLATLTGSAILISNKADKNRKVNIFSEKIKAIIKSDFIQNYWFTIILFILSTIISIMF